MISSQRKYELAENDQNFKTARHVESGFASYSWRIHDLPAEVDRNIAMKAANAVFDESVSLWQIEDPMELQKRIEAAVDRTQQLWDVEMKNAKPPFTWVETLAASRSAVLTIWSTGLSSSFLHSERQAILNNAMTRMLLSAAAVKAKTGKWPGSLTELIPGEFKELPTEGLWSKYVQYSVTPERGAHFSGWS